MIKKFTLSLLGAAALLGSAQLAFADDTAATPIAPKPPVLETRDSYMTVVRPDMRKCMYPMCGGYFVKNVNKPTTRCADGTQQRECHAVQLNPKLLGWDADQLAAFEQQFAQGKALVKGYLEPAPAGQFTADQLTLTEAWQAQGPRSPLGTYYGVKSTGIVCIKAPCPSLAATKLNVIGATINPDLELGTSGANEKQIQAGLEALNTTGILAAGVVVPVRYPGNTRGQKLLASQFYLPASPKAEAPVLVTDPGPAAQ